MVAGRGATVILLAVVALAAEPVLVVMPSSGGPDLVSVERALERAELVVAEVVAAPIFAADVRVVAPPTTWGDDCLKTTHLAAWRERLDAARRRYDLFDAEGSLADLVLLDLELECLADPVPAATLVSLDVARAEAHLLLEASNAHDLGQASFHVAEAARALDRVVATGPDLVPAEASPELEAGLAAARRRARKLSHVAATPLPRGEALRLNGRLLGAAGGAAAEGDNLLQRVDGTGSVVGAARLSLRPGEVAMVSGLVDGAGLVDLVEALARRMPTRDEESVLAALAEVRVAGATVVYAGWNGGPTLWQVSRGRLVRLAATSAPRGGEREEEPLDEPLVLTVDEPRRERREPPDRERPAVVERVRLDAPAERAEAVDRWRATAGLRLGAGWREEGGLAAVAMGLAGRVAIAGDWAVAWGVLPEAEADSLDPGGEGVRARVPVRVGARWGPRRAGWAAEVGADVGLVALPEVAAPRPLLGACGGASASTGPTVALRLEGCVDTDLVGASVGAALSVESRI